MLPALRDIRLDVDGAGLEAHQGVVEERDRGMALARAVGVAVQVLRLAERLAHDFLIGCPGGCALQADQGRQSGAEQEQRLWNPPCHRFLLTYSTLRTPSPRRRGSMTSRRASPSRLKASTATRMANPEKPVTHGA